MWGAGSWGDGAVLGKAQARAAHTEPALGWAGCEVRGGEFRAGLTQRSRGKYNCLYMGLDSLQQEADPAGLWDGSEEWEGFVEVYLLIN